MQSTPIKSEQEEVDVKSEQEEVDVAGPSKKRAHCSTCPGATDKKVNTQCSQCGAATCKVHAKTVCYGCATK